MVKPATLLIKLRSATPADLNLLQYRDTLPHVIDSDPHDDWNWEVELKRDPSWREQLVAEEGGRPGGFVQIIDPHEEESGYWGKTSPGFRAVDIWIGEPSDLGKAMARR